MDLKTWNIRAAVKTLPRQAYPGLEPSNSDQSGPSIIWGWTATGAPRAAQTEVTDGLNCSWGTECGLDWENYRGPRGLSGKQAYVSEHWECCPLSASREKPPVSFLFLDKIILGCFHVSLTRPWLPQWLDWVWVLLVLHPYPLAKNLELYKL